MLALARHRTLGDRLCGFKLELPTGWLPRLWRLVARAALRLVVALVVLSVFGLATQHVGEGAAGIAVGALAAWVMLVMVCRVAADGATTILERACHVRVHQAPQVVHRTAR